VRVAFDSRAAADRGGIGRYVRSLLPALRRLAHGAVFEADRPGRADVFHAPCVAGALLRPPTPMVVTVHDLVPLKRRGELLRAGLRVRLRSLAVERAVRLIVPTRVVAEDAAELLHVDRGRIVVVPEAATPHLGPRSAGEVASVRANYGLPERYLLWVGDLEHPEPRKRVAELAATRRRLPLVLVGAAGRWVRELDDVTVTGQVPDRDLAAMYTGAHALVFPSDDEGFGLPPVEALACGTPVAACDVPALREVLGDRASFVPPGDLDALVAAAEAASRPAPAPPAWSWEDAARATWDVYREAAASRGPAVPRRASDRR